MIIVTLNEDRYAYDIHSLVKAFYPEQDVKVFAEGTKEEQSDAGMPAFFVIFKEEEICAGITGKTQKTIRLGAPQDKGAVKNDLKQIYTGSFPKKRGKRCPGGR